MAAILNTKDGTFMKLEGISVVHKSFGKGKVVARSGDYLTVLFAIGEKSFQYPEAFKVFLSTEDASATDAIQKDIAEYENKQTAVRLAAANAAEESKRQVKPTPRAAGKQRSAAISVESVGQAVAAIPHGNVMTYADIAEYITGSRKGIQTVSTIILGNSQWENGHRVVMAEGKLNPAYKGGLGPEVQRKKLEAEGVQFDYSSKVPINKFKWKWRSIRQEK